MPENNPPLFDPHDPMQVAVKFAQMEGAMNSMQLANTNSNQNLATAIQGLQNEVRDLGRGISSITQLESDRQAHSEGLARAFEAIAKLSAMHERAWEQHSAQELAYRERTAGENKATRDKQLRWSGAALATSLFIGALVATVTYIYNTDKANNERDVDTMREAQAEHLRDADKRFDKIEGVLIESCSERGKPCQFR